MSIVKSFLCNFKVVHSVSPHFPQKVSFLKKLATKAIGPQYLVFLTFFSEIYIHYAGKLINTRGRSAALYLHNFFLTNQGWIKFNRHSNNRLQIYTSCYSLKAYHRKVEIFQARSGFYLCTLRELIFLLFAKINPRKIFEKWLFAKINPREIYSLTLSWIKPHQTCKSYLHICNFLKTCKSF